MPSVLLDGQLTLNITLAVLIQRDFSRIVFCFCFLTFPALTPFSSFILGSIFWAENASHVSMYAGLSLFTDFI